MTTPEEKIKPARGESFVFLSSLGLALGLLMVIGILGLIAVKGAQAFWPRRVITITLAPSTPEAQKLQGAATLGGEVTDVRYRSEKTADGITEHEEWLVYVANREMYGLSFIWTDKANIENEVKDKDVLKIERRSNHFALGVPQSLTLTGGQVIPFGQAEFDTKLKDLVATVNEQQDRIHDIKMRKIGSINSRMKLIQTDIRLLTEAGEASGKLDEAKLADLNSRMEYQRSLHTELMTEAEELERQLDVGFMTIRLLNGGERELPISDMMNYYYPNRLSFIGRIGTWIRNIYMFVTDDPREAGTAGGIFPTIFGTFVLTVLMSAAVMPFGVITAIYLHEYAKQGGVVRAVRIAINNLAGVPSIVFGMFGVGFFVYYMGKGVDSLFFSDSDTATFATPGLLWASLTLALMTVPVVIVATEEALAAVPRGARDGSLALGASKWQTIWRVVLPASGPGIMTGLILAMARGAGEVAPLMLVGVVNHVSTLPINGDFPYLHLDQKFMHLGFHIYDLGFQSPDSQAAIPMVFATTFLLILLVVVMNLSGIIIRERMRRKYRTNTF